MSDIEKEFKNRLLTFIGGGFGLVAGLAWNDAISSLINYLFPLSKDSLPIKFIYALAITIIVVIILSYLGKILSPKKD